MDVDKLFKLPKLPSWPIYILYFVATNPSFRLPELQSALKYLKSDYALIPTPLDWLEIRGEREKRKRKREEEKQKKKDKKIPSNQDQQQRHDDDHDQEEPEWIPSTNSPFYLIHLPNDSIAFQLSQRLITLRSIHHHWSSSLTLPDLHLQTQSAPSRSLWSQFSSPTISWKSNVVKHNRSKESFEKTREIIDSFSYMDFLGRIDLQNPLFTWSVLFDYDPPQLSRNPLKSFSSPSSSSSSRGDQQEDKVQKQDQDQHQHQHHQEQTEGNPQSNDRPNQIFLGRSITKEDQYARNLINKLDLKKRNYIGNTSMEAEMSLIMASMALAGPSTLIYDPFVGTGSMLYACAAFGSMVSGSDIDIRMIRGKGDHDQIGVMRSATQYGLQGKILDCLGFDMTQHPWRVGGIFDAIVTDPPYGVRAGAKRLGRKDLEKLKTEPFILPDGRASHTLSDYVPPSQPYHLLDLISDLLEFSAFLLKPGGRLVFWIPTMTEVETFGTTVGSETGLKEKPVELPESDRFRLVHHSLQDFGKWGRRLVTMERLPPTSVLPSARENGDAPGSESAEKPWHITPSQHKRGAEKDKIQYGQDLREFRNQYYMPKDKVKKKQTNP